MLLKVVCEIFYYKYRLKRCSQKELLAQQEGLILRAQNNKQKDEKK